MECRREKESNACFLEAPLDDGRAGGDVHAERLEEIRAAALAGDRPVAVFGDAHAACRHDQRGDRRDVEGVGSIATRAARVEHRRSDFFDSGAARSAHRPRETDDLRRAAPLHRQCDQKAGYLRR